MHLSRDEECNEDQEKKREWLKEKNNGEAEDDEGKEKTDENEKQGEGKKGKKDTTKFAGLPSGFLHCFVCDKSMWDGESFQNHIRGWFSLIK